MDTKARQMKGNIYWGKSQVSEQSKVITSHYSAKREIFFFFCYLSAHMLMSSLNKAGKRKLYKPKYVRTQTVYRWHSKYMYS